MAKINTEVARPWALKREAKDIQQGDISSVFYVHHYQVNPQTLTVEVSGIERWWFGEKKMSDKTRTYQLKYQWRGGRLTIESFALALPNESNKEGRA